MPTLPQKISLEEVFSTKARVRIIKLLISEGEMNITQLTRKTCLNHKIVSSNIKVLSEKGIISTEKIGRIRTCKINKSNPRAKLLAKFISEWQKRL